MTCFQQGGKLEVGHRIIFQTATFQAPERFIDLGSEKVLCSPRPLPFLTVSLPVPGLTVVLATLTLTPPLALLPPIFLSQLLVVLSSYRTHGRHPPPASTQLPGLVFLPCSIYSLATCVLAVEPCLPPLLPN